MADNIKVLPSTGGSDPPVATDDIGGIHFQKIKAGWGIDGVFQETADTDGVRLPIGGAQVGTLTESAPGTDTASSGLNGRLQRIAQRITSLIALVPASLGQKTMANSFAVTLASDQGAQTVSQAVMAAATAVDAGAEATTDEAIIGAAAGTRLIGFSARETTGTAGAVFNIRHGTSNAGTILVSVSLGTNESAREWYGSDGIAAASGIWLERVSGTIQLVGYYKVVV